MEELVLDSGVRKIAIKNEDGDVITVLSINVADADTAERFGQVINKLERISENCEKEAAAWKKEHAQDTEDEKTKIDEYDQMMAEIRAKKKAEKELGLV